LGCTELCHIKYLQILKVKNHEKCIQKHDYRTEFICFDD